MAAEGFLLNGYFAGFASFEKNEPRAVRYRLDAAQKGASLFSSNGGIPDAEILSLNRSYGWSYITNRGPFHIYASCDGAARELHTEPEIQAVTLDIVRKQEWGGLLCIFYYLALFPLISLGGFYPLLIAAAIGTPRFLSGVLLALWAFLGSCKKVLFLKRLRNRLARGETPDHHKDWHRYAFFRRLLSFAFPVLCLIWFASILMLPLEAAADKNTVPLTDYPKALPFATIKELIPEGSFYNADHGNRITTGSDWLAPAIISLHETGAIRFDGDRVLEGVLTVAYYETRSPFLARELAREYENRDRRKNKKYYQKLSLPSLDTDYAAAYRALFPTLLITDGSRMIRITFYQDSEEYGIPLEEWAEDAAEYFTYFHKMKGDHYE